MPRYEFRCKICETLFEEVQKMNTKHIAFHCNIRARRVFSLFQTNKDLMYNFTTNAFGEPVIVHSRRQYKKLLKANKCVDATVSDCLSVKRKDNSKEKIGKFSKEVTKEIHAKGLTEWVKKGSATMAEEKTMIEKIKKEKE